MNFCLSQSTVHREGSACTKGGLGPPRNWGKRDPVGAHQRGRAPEGEGHGNRGGARKRRFRANGAVEGNRGIGVNLRKCHVASLPAFFCVALLCSVPTRRVPSPVFASPFCAAPTFAHPVSVRPPLPPSVFARPLPFTVLPLPPFSALDCLVFAETAFAPPFPRSFHWHAPLPNALSA